MISISEPGRHLTFAEIVDSWVFCGSRLLLYKWERARILAEGDKRLVTLRKIEEKLAQELAKDERRDNIRPTVQRNFEGLYVSPLIAGRFQVLQSFTPWGTYYVCDHTIPDMLVREGGPAGPTKRFFDRESAENWISQFTGGEIQVTTPRFNPRTQGDTPMAKSAKKVEATPAPAAKGPAKFARIAPPVEESNVTPIIRGRKKAEPAPVAAPSPAPAKGRKKAETVATPAPVASSGRGKPISFDVSTLAGLARTRIKEGRDDDAVLKELRAKFGETVPANAARHYRADMTNRGLI